MAKRKGSPTSRAGTSSQRESEEKVELDAREAESAKRLLDKLPPEVWEKILGELKNDDLFPLALSCRYFRQKQKELVARTGQSGPGREVSRLALKTDLERKLDEDQPASADYIRFCSKEEVPSEGAPMRAQRIMSLAAQRGYLTLLKELQEEFKLDEYVFMHASAGGHMETLKWLRSEGCPWNEMACTRAAEGGHLETLKWLRSEGCPWDAYACAGAAGHGHLEILKWLRSEGCPWDEVTCKGAAEGAHLEILKWLRSEGCPLDAWTCQSAARGGHLEVLKWLRSEGCPWDEWACMQAARFGYLDVLKWAIDNGCPYIVTPATQEAFASLGLA